MTPKKGRAIDEALTFNIIEATSTSPQGVVLILRDVSKQLESEKAMRSSLERLQLILERSPTATAITRAGTQELIYLESIVDPPDRLPERSSPGSTDALLALVGRHQNRPKYSLNS